MKQLYHMIRSLSFNFLNFKIFHKIFAMNSLITAEPNNILIPEVISPICNSPVVYCCSFYSCNIRVFLWKPLYYTILDHISSNSIGGKITGCNRAFNVRSWKYDVIKDINWFAPIVIISFSASSAEAPFQLYIPAITILQKKAYSCFLLLQL